MHGLLLNITLCMISFILGFIDWINSVNYETIDLYVLRTSHMLSVVATITVIVINWKQIIKIFRNLLKK